MGKWEYKILGMSHELLKITENFNNLIFLSALRNWILNQRSSCDFFRTLLGIYSYSKISMKARSGFLALAL